MANQDDSDYEVGYGKPPRHSQFRRGQSGNPAGRPPGRKNLATIVRAVLHEEIIVTENGKSRKATKVEIVIAQMVNGALKGDQRAIRETIALKRYVDALEEVDAVPTETESDAAIMASLKRRLQRATNSNTEKETSK
ncbi:DUF5681 domain-containing protein [Terriglobus sp. TAA 43]|uniref:DUF5681 domain-containing protein n=1 Tax=Terriglobus sp. TAA 43 TaxID=278961 RepID=UPI00068BD4EC|nr:DUF5681 domain-containing protein [Terriglobus sp. TAA 43]